MESIFIVSKARGNFIVVTHQDSDPGSWIVRRWKKFLWIKRRISSDWFTDKEQAMTFAYEMKLMIGDSGSMRLTRGKL